MRTKLMIALASLSIVAIGASGCDRKTAEVPHDVEGANAGSTNIGGTNIGGGPNDDDSSGASGTVNVLGESTDISSRSTAHAGSPESTPAPPGMTHPVETEPSEVIVP